MILEYQRISFKRIRLFWKGDGNAREHLNARKTEVLDLTLQSWALLIEKNSKQNASVKDSDNGGASHLLERHFE